MGEPGPSSPFASSAHYLDRLLDASGRIKTLVAQRSGADRNAQQLAKFMPFFDLLVEELKEVESAPYGWAQGLLKIQSALEAIVQLLQNTAESSVVMAIMAGRFSAGYKGVAQLLSEALHGLNADGSGLDEDTVHSIDHLRKRLNSAKFGPDANEQKAADEIRMQAATLDMGRLGTTPEDCLNSIVAALKSALHRDLTEDELQLAIASLQHMLNEAAPGSMGPEIKVMTHLKDALQLEQSRREDEARDKLASLARASSGMQDDFSRLYLGTSQSFRIPQSGFGAPAPNRVDVSNQAPPSRVDVSNHPPLANHVSWDSQTSTPGSIPRSIGASRSETRPSMERLPSGTEHMSVTSDEQENTTDRSYRSSEGSSWQLSDRDQPTGGSDRRGSGHQLKSQESAPLSNASTRSDGSHQGIGQIRSWKSQPTSSSLATLQGHGDRDDADWIIAEDEITICLKEDGSEFLLGKGAFGKVYKAMLGKVEPVALKILGGEAEDGASAEAAARALRELKLLRDARNPHIVQFLGAVLFRKQIAIVTELMPLGDLHSALAGQRIQWGPRALRIAIDVARGLAFLHRKRIAHLDLKSPNILLGRDYTAKIADVGIARVLTDSQVSTVTSTGTFAWAAPELLLGNKVTELADIYSFGVVLWELVTGEQPRRGQLRSLRVPEEAPEEVDTLVAQCMEMDPNLRPDAKQCTNRLVLLTADMPAPPPDSPTSSAASVRDSALPSQNPLARISRDMTQSSRRLDNRGSMASQPSTFTSSLNEAGFGGSPFALGRASSTMEPRRISRQDTSASMMEGYDDRVLNSTSDFDDMGSQAGDPGMRCEVRFPPTGMPKLERQLQDLVQNDCLVRDLNLAERGLNTDQSIAVAVMLAHNRSLKRLDFRRNRPELKGLQKLMAALQRNKDLVFLDLRDCVCGREGGQAIAGMLRNNNVLCELSLWNTGLRQEGACAILRALQSNTGLQRLDLGCNELGPEVGKEVAAMLKRNTGLEVLDLRNNRLGKPGVTAIVEATRDNNALRQLKLGNNAMSTMFGAGSIKSIIKEREKTTGLSIQLS
ncbi:hypothetical protein WJX73_002262 [Symbiochloris irregularis]|uniref:Protein kinase domain-containing protein n=1 Tax=Symbiochloris irregularis TaxID=706552 RepID=A0AAW1NKB5_9CHLO